MKHFLKNKYYKNGKIVQSIYTDYSDDRCYGSKALTSQLDVKSGKNVPTNGSPNFNAVVQADSLDGLDFLSEAESLSAPAFEPGSSMSYSKSKIDESGNSRAVYNAIHSLIDVLDNNFSTNDKEVTLTVSSEGFDALFGSGTAEENLTTMRVTMQKVYRNVRLMAARVGIPCKYVWVISNIDGDSGKSVRIHAHGVINGDILNMLKKVWSPFGSVNAKPLRERNHTYAALARYMIVQSCVAPGEKRYSVSRNLEKPVEIKQKIPAPLPNIVFTAPPASVLVGCNVFPGYIRAIFFSQALKDNFSGYIQCLLNNTFPTFKSSGTVWRGRKQLISQSLPIRS